MEVLAVGTGMGVRGRWVDIVVDGVKGERGRARDINTMTMRMGMGVMGTIMEQEEQGRGNRVLMRTSGCRGMM